MAPNLTSNSAAAASGPLRSDFEVEANVVQDGVEAELQRLDPQDIIVVGGTTIVFADYGIEPTTESLGKFLGELHPASRGIERVDGLLFQEGDLFRRNVRQSFLGDIPGPDSQQTRGGDGQAHLDRFSDLAPVSQQLRVLRQPVLASVNQAKSQSKATSGGSGGSTSSGRRSPRGR